MNATYYWSRRERIERFAGRLPRKIAYPLIFFIAIALWSPIAIVAMALLSRCS